MRCLDDAALTVFNCRGKEGHVMSKRLPTKGKAGPSIRSESCGILLLIYTLVTWLREENAIEEVDTSNSG
jgi:hypothetical protein